MTFTFTSLINALGWTLIHSLWQAGLVFLILELLLKYLRQSPAKIRYLLSSFALAGIFICSLFTFYFQWEYAQNLNETAIIAVGSSTASGNSGTIVPGTGNLLFHPGAWIFHLVILYGIGWLFFTARFLRDLLIMKRIRYTRSKPFDKAWEHHLEKLATAWHIPRKVSLFLSEKIDVPVVIGYFKPAIYLPFSVASHLPPEQIEVILLHELAHIKRCDFIANMLQTLVETLLFFNPFVWWISKKIRVEREQSCDDLVLADKEPALYAESLLALEENRLYNGRFVLAAVHKKQQLFHRIKRIMEMKTRKLNAFQKLFVLLFMAAALVSVSWLTPKKKEPANHPKNKTDVLTTPLVSTPPDTTIPQPFPPFPLPASARTQPAPPPVSATNNPPAPPFPPLMDSIPKINDSAIAQITGQLHHYFNSKDWKKYAHEMKAYAAGLKQYYRSEDWQKYRKKMEDYTQKIQHYFNSDEWRDQQAQIRQQITKLKQQFKSPEWKKQMDSIRQAFPDKPAIDSILDQVKSRISFITKQDTAILLLSSNGKTIHTDQFINRLKRDGLLKDKNNYKINLGPDGLFINGKKQPDRYFKKYRLMVGEKTRIKIKNKGDRYSSSINTSD